MDVTQFASILPRYFESLGHCSNNADLHVSIHICPIHPIGNRSSKGVMVCDRSRRLANKTNKQAKEV